MFTVGVVLLTRIVVSAEVCVLLLLRLFASAMRKLSFGWLRGRRGASRWLAEAVVRSVLPLALWLWRLGISASRVHFHKEAVDHCSWQRARESLQLLATGMGVLPALLGAGIAVAVYWEPVTVATVADVSWWLHVSRLCLLLTCTVPTAIVSPIGWLWCRRTGCEAA